MKNAQANIESYHRQQLETGFEDSPSEGVIRGQLIRPIERVGTYGHLVAPQPIPPPSS